MTEVRAHSVANADHLNEAASVYGVSPALLQGMLDIDDVLIFDLPDAAREQALEIARQDGGAVEQGSDGESDPRCNILAAAWYLANTYEMRGSQHDAVAYFYGNTPRARIKATRIFAGPYERRRRAWSS